MTEQAKHAQRAPSAAKRWTTCTASIRDCEGLESPPSFHSEQGTVAHNLLEKAINTKTDPLKLPAPDPKYDEDGLMRTHVQKVYDDIKPILGHKDFIVESEKLVTIDENCYGTADVIVLSKGNLHIVDLKYGKGILVEVDDPQLLVYAWAAYLEACVSSPWPIDTITRTVWQPRAFHKDGYRRSITKTVAEVEAEYNERIQPAHDKIDRGEFVYLPSVDACRFCEKKNTPEGCEALKAESLKKAQSYFSSDSGALVVPTIHQVETKTAEELAAILEGEDLFKMFFKAVQARALALAKAGHKIPGYGLGKSSKHRKFDFKTDAETIEFLMKELKLKRGDAVTEKVITPAAAEKLLEALKRGKEAKLAKLAEKVVQPPGNTILVKVDPGTEPTGYFEPIPNKNEEKQEEEVPDFLK